MEGPTELVENLGHSMECGLAGDLNAYQDKVTWQEMRNRAAFIDTIVVCLTMIAAN
jgi:hypothetical protein